MPLIITEDDRDRRRQGARIAREARRRKLAAERATDPTKLSQAVLTVRAGIELGHLAPADVLPGDGGR